MCVCVLGGPWVLDAYVVVEGLLHLRPLVSACLLSLSFLRSLTGTFTHSRTRHSLFQAVPGGDSEGQISKRKCVCVCLSRKQATLLVCEACLGLAVCECVCGLEKRRKFNVTARCVCFLDALCEHGTLGLSCPYPTLKLSCKCF